MVTRIISGHAGRTATDGVTPEASISTPTPLAILYMLFAIALLALYAYTLWSNQNDVGRVNAWVIRFREYLNGAR